jgi:magnesium chelatase subunit ChlD-like protein
VVSQNKSATYGNKFTGKCVTMSRGLQSAQLHWPRTLLKKRGAQLTRAHFSFKEKAARGGILHCFVLDCSGSMLATKQLALAQGALHHLHQRAYQQRADVALVTYAGDKALIRLHPSAARPINALQIDKSLQLLQGGGATPITLGVAKADALLAENRRRKPAQQTWLWLLSDGRSNQFPERPKHADVLQVVDCEQQRIALNRCQQIAEYWQADYRTLTSLLEI